MSGGSAENNALTEAQEVFLEVVKSFVRGQVYHFPAGFTQAEELYKMAVVHKLGAAVLEQVRTEALLQTEPCAALFGTWKRESVMEVMLQVQRTDGFLRVYRKMCEQGARPLVVKGIICRNLYEKADYRTSGDEDILVRKEDFAVCDAVLLEEGFQREEADDCHLPQEIPYLNPRSGVYIEMHFSLFAEESGAYGHLNQEFTDVWNSAVCEEIQGTPVWTLAPTLHLLYLICHSLKHFLHGGFGIRQVCDMVMMAEHFGEQIDWPYLDMRLQALRMKCFWDNLVQIGVRYLDFSCGKAHCPTESKKTDADCMDLLLDLLNSGIYGDSTAERKHSSNITLAAAESGHKDTAASVRASLFPGREYMKRGYPWLERFPWLLPAAWGMRIFRYLRSAAKKDRSQSGSVEIGMSRVELLREYDIID